MAVPTISDFGDELHVDTEEVTITGTNFGTSQGNGKVWLSPTNNVNDGARVEQTVLAWSDTSITIRVVRGALSLLTNLYLFVTNGTAETNASGYVTQIEGGLARYYLQTNISATISNTSGLSRNVQMRHDQ